MKSKIIYYVIWLVLSVAIIKAQTTKEEFYKDTRYASGIYSPYVYVESKSTDAPKGFKPFYISHYGRHGSRYLEPAERYTVPFNVLNEANKNNKLTQFGKSLLNRIEIIYKDAENRYGDVTPLGIEEHKQIAERMFNNYPEIFKSKGNKNPYIYSRSTVVPRCILSMAANNERLKELNPKIITKRDATKRDVYVGNSYKVSYRDSINALSKKFIEDNFDTKSFIAKIFNDVEYAKNTIKDQADFVNDIYYLVAAVKDVPHIKVNMDDVFTKDEIFTLWQATNIKLYLVFTSKAAVDSSKLLLKNILDCADSAIKNNNIAADLRFGHDSYIAPLLTLMKVNNWDVIENDPNNVYKVWCDYKVAGMGANLVLVFYRNDKNDVLVKFIHNEKDATIPIKPKIANYYDWNEVKDFYTKLIK